MTRQQLIEQIFSKETYLCIGLDTDPAKIPTHLQSMPDAVFRFNKAIIDKTKEFCVSYKINTAFYEAQGVKGWEALEQTVNYIPSSHFKIADAKRGDIGNTSSQYAKAFFETLKFDAVTVAPYMGSDSVLPFLSYKDKWTILLALTSNKGACDFALQKIINDVSQKSKEKNDDEPAGYSEYLFEKVLRRAIDWGTEENLMFVAGATQSASFRNIRKITPNHFLLVPGVGTQGGSLQELSEIGLTKDCGLLVNVSRAIIYASEEENFAEEAAAIASQYQFEMKALLAKFAI